jgi:hypothetical protein
MENIIADTEIRKPESGEGFQETSGVLFGGGKVPVGHDTDRVSPAPCLADAVQHDGIEEERFTALEVDPFHGSQVIRLIEECADLAWRERPLRIRAAADETVFARHRAHIGCKDMDLGYHGVGISGNEQNLS